MDADFRFDEQPFLGAGLEIGKERIVTISLIGVLVFLIIVGLILYIVQLLPIDAMIKRICYVVVLVFVLLWLLQLLGGFSPVIRLT